MADEKTPVGSNNAGNVVGWLEGILKLKATYGLGNIISAIMLLFVAITVGVVAFKPTIILEEIQKFQAEQHQEAIQRRLEADPQVRNALIDLRSTLDADRVFIVEAHNGGTNLTNLPFLYVDMTYENCKSDEPLIQDEYKNVRLQRYDFSSFVYDNSFWFGSVEELKDIDPIFYYRLKGDGVNHFGILTLYGEYNVIGAICVEYTTSTPRDYITVKQTLYKIATKVGILLNYEKKK